MSFIHATTKKLESFSDREISRKKRKGFPQVTCCTTKYFGALECFQIFSRTVTQDKHRLQKQAERNQSMIWDAFAGRREGTSQVSAHGTRWLCCWHLLSRLRETVLGSEFILWQYRATVRPQPGRGLKPEQAHSTVKSKFKK